MKNNKGFTLIEVIIAISIMSIVIGLGYNVINKANGATKEQSNISENQLNANLVNKYLTKDLEFCKDIEEGPNLIQGYQIIIKGKNDNQITYKVSTETKGNQETYSLTRIDNVSEIDLIKNQPKVSERPFFISKKDGEMDLYVVELDSNKETLDKYKFEVASRALVSMSEVELDEISKEFVENKFHKAEFWVNNLDNNHVEIGVFHNGLKKGNGSEIYTDEKNVEKNLDDKYKINMKISISNAGSQDNIFINEKYKDVGWKEYDEAKIAGITSKYQTQNLKLDQGKVIIDVGKNTEFELEVNDTFIVPNKGSGETINLKTGTYEYDLKVDSNGNKVRELIVKGSIIKNTQNARIKIYYGKKK